jgi:hypothetical protein
MTDSKADVRPAPHMAAIRRDVEWSHPPWSPCALALLHEGPWYGNRPDRI